MTYTFEKSNIEADSETTFRFEFLKNKDDKLFESKKQEPGQSTVGWSSQPFQVSFTSVHDKYYLIIYKCRS